MSIMGQLIFEIWHMCHQGDLKTNTLSFGLTKQKFVANGADCFYFHDF